MEPRITYEMKKGHDCWLIWQTIESFENERGSSNIYPIFFGEKKECEEKLKGLKGKKKNDRKRKNANVQR